MDEDLELKLIRAIEAKERRMEEREERQLAEVKSYAEYFEDDFFRESKKVKVGNRTLHDFIIEETGINEYVVSGQLKNNINENNLIEELLKIVEVSNEKEYQVLAKYKDEISVVLKYQGVFVFDYACDCYVNRVAAKYISKHRGFSVTPYNDIESKKGRLLIGCPKGKLDKNSINSCNLEEVVQISAKPPKTNKNLYDVYKVIKRELTKQIENELKLSHNKTNYCLRGINFDSISLTYLLVPYYSIRCSNPGIDVKCIINANSKKFVK